MSDVARKVFSMEKVLALVVGKLDDIDVKDVASYLTGRSIVCDCCLKAVAPMAAGWLASLYPAFINMEYNSEQSWDAYVNSIKSSVGDSVSLIPMSGSLQSNLSKLLDSMADAYATIESQTAEIGKLSLRVEELEPFQKQAQDLDSKCQQLEAQAKTQKTEMGALRRELIPYQGKVAVDQEGLESIIKDAIKSNMKGLVVGGVAAGAVAGAVAGEAVAEEASGEPEGSYGFNATGEDGDGFGF